MTEPKLTVFVFDDGSKPLGVESPLARRLSLRRIRLHAPWARVELVSTDCAGSCLKVLHSQATPNLAFLAHPEMFVGPEWTKTPLELLDMEPSVGLVGVVSNTSASAAQSIAPPFPYQTPHLLDLAVTQIRREAPLRWLLVDALEPFCCFLRSTDFRALAKNVTGIEDLPGAVLKSGKKLALALDTYVHRYGSLYEQPRPDLLDRVPAGARCVLDVGCARGRFGLELKRRGCPRVVGIERDPLLAHAAKDLLDQVVNADVESIEDGTFEGHFDAVVCGDVVEHLVEPFQALSRFRSWLNPGGRLLLSVPNVGHWSILMDLMAGRWDYAPFTILSGTHLRFFTRRSVRELLEESGYRVEQIDDVKPPIPPIGEAFIRRLKAVDEIAPESSLLASEFIVTAQKA
ncbi:MAG: class I SAM-dependent methyltransferase [Deltaproteobacteria bacterium]|nr:class I SAM-dependent methyltransferase [Deltaproteobacteria bacterium]